jgi:pre-mRNA-splicing factor 38B
MNSGENFNCKGDEGKRKREGEREGRERQTEM